MFLFVPVWLLSLLGNSQGFFKFPRTHHLFDTGGSAVSRDDLVMDDAELAMWYGKNARVLTVQGSLSIGECC